MSGSSTWSKTPTRSSRGASRGCSSRSRWCTAGAGGAQQGMQQQEQGVDSRELSCAATLKAWGGTASSPAAAPTQAPAGGGCSYGGVGCCSALVCRARCKAGPAANSRHKCLVSWGGPLPGTAVGLAGVRMPLYHRHLHRMCAGVQGSCPGSSEQRDALHTLPGWVRPWPTQSPTCNPACNVSTH